MSSFYIKKPEGILIKVFVQPRSSKNMVMGLHDDSLKVKLTAPPVDGAANKMCITFFAKLLGVSKSTIEIISGHASRNKSILVAIPDDNPNKKERDRLLRLLDKFKN